MHKMLAAFDRQATFSLREIKQCMELSGESMDEEFRMYFLQMSNQRYSIVNLSMIFNWKSLFKCSFSNLLLCVDWKPAMPMS